MTPSTLGSVKRGLVATAAALALAGSGRAEQPAGLFDWAFVDLFAGAGGASLGTERALVKAGYRDKYVDLMVNHWDVAVGVHQANHPMTEHLRCSVWEVNPETVLLGRRILHLHLSPDCTDFSKAKGGAPKRKHIRALADVGLVWAEKRRPVFISLENVEEFREWGPLMHKRHTRRTWVWTKRPAGKDKPAVTVYGPKMSGPDADAFIARHEKAGHSVEPFLCPDPAKRGQEFRRWKNHLEELGYAVEVRELRASDYGTPTTRKRLFVLARCDGRPIVWPEKTHGKRVHHEGTKVAKNTTNTQAEENHGDVTSGSLGMGEAAGIGVRRSGRRAGGLGVDGVGSAKASGNHGARRARVGNADADGRASGHAGADARVYSRLQLKPFRTAAECIDFSLPMLSIFATRAEAVSWARRLNVGRAKHERMGTPQRPLRPKTHARLAGGLLKHVLAAAEPFILNIENYGWKGQTRSVHDGLSTITAYPKGGKHTLCDVKTAGFASTLNHGGTESRSKSLAAPIDTILGANDARALVGVDAMAMSLNKHNTGVIGQGVDLPVGAITGINHHKLMAVSIARYNGEKVASEARGQAAADPISTLDTQNRFAAVGVDVAPYIAITSHTGTTGRGRYVDSVHDPLKTTCATNDKALISAHVVKFRGESVGHAATDPLATITSGAGSERDAGAAHALGLSAIYLSHMYTSNSNGGQGDPCRPLKTITSGGQHAKVCCVYLSPYYGNSKDGATPADPAPTIVGKDRFGLVQVDTVPASDAADSLDTPHAPFDISHPHWLFTPAALKRARQVARWAMKQLKQKVMPYLLWVDDPATGKRFPLLSLSVRGALHLVTDIAIRMLRPRELARCQGFPDDYIIDHYIDRVTGAMRRLRTADQVKLIGNSVPPDFLEAIVTANLVDQGLLEISPWDIEAVGAGPAMTGRAA